MEFIIIKLKEFFCKHDYEIIDVPEWEQDVILCSKCSKIIYDDSKFKTK